MSKSLSQPKRLGIHANNLFSIDYTHNCGWARDLHIKKEIGLRGIPDRQISVNNFPK